MIRTAVKLALFAGVCLLFTAYLAFTIGNIHLFRDEYTLHATFDDVTGLLPNDNVKIAGVGVGKVTGVKIREGRARVSFTVRDDVKVPADSTAAVRWRNLLGQRYVYVYPGEAATTLRPGDEVERTVPVVDLGELFNRLGPIVRAIEPEKVNVFLDTMVAALDGNEAKVRQVIADLATLTGGLATRDAAIGRLIEQTNAVAGAVERRDAQIRLMLDNLVAVATTFNENTDVLDAAVTDLSQYSDNLGGLLADNRVHLDGSIDSLARLVEVVRAKLGTVDHALGNLDDVARALFNASRHGEWLNQTIPCGIIGYSPRVAVNDCVKDAGSVPGSSSGAAAVRELLGGGAR